MPTPQGTRRSPSRQRLTLRGPTPNSSGDAVLCDAERVEGRAEFGRGHG